MIISQPHANYECVTARFEDETGRISLHVHRNPNGKDWRLRQIELLAQHETVFSLDVIFPAERMECDL